VATDGTRRLVQELLSATFVLVKNSLVFDQNNPALLRACDRMSAAVNDLRGQADGAASIQFLTDGVYVNNQLARLDSGAYEQGEYLYTVWRNLGVGEIAALEHTESSDWLELSAELIRCIRTGERQTLRDRTFARVKLSPLEAIAYAQEGESGERPRALRAYTIAGLVMEETLDDLRNGRRVRIVDLKRPLQELIGVVPTCRDLLLALTLLKRNKITLADHLVNTATLVICMAEELDLDRSVRTDLALQACLHGIGRAFDAAGDTETREAEYAIESVCALLRLSSTPEKNIGRVVAANEARLWANADPATGNYPYPPAGPALLIAAATAYDLLTTPTASRPALLPDESLRVIMAEAGRRYDDAVVRVMTDMLGVFPVGSVVALSDGRAGIVVRASSCESGWARPVVKIVRDTNGALVDGPRVDLSAQDASELDVRGCIDAEEQGINLPAFLRD